MLTLSLKAFYTAIRPFFGGTLTQTQVSNMDALLAEAVAHIDTVEGIAYLLATVAHEAGKGMAPVEEIGRGAGHDYGRFLDAGAGPGKRVTYTTPAKLYYGRGHIQLTWRSNYLALGRAVGVDLLNQPELMLSVAVSAKVAVFGMVHGSFTGKKLADYFGPGKHDPIMARSIINGRRKGEKLPDRAELIAGYYEHFCTALLTAQAAAAVVIKTAEKQQQPAGQVKK